MDRLKNKTDVVDSMIFPVPENVSEKAGPDELIDPEKIKNIPVSSRRKKISIIRDNTSLRKGPGTKYMEIGTATKGDQFDLLRVERGFGKGQTWYLVEDDTGNKFFISSKLSAITREKSEKPPITAAAKPPIKPESIFPQGEPSDKIEKVELQ